MRGNLQTFSAKDAIVNHFGLPESNIELRCEKCSFTTCSKEITLQGPPEFILIQFKRFKVIRMLRNKEAQSEKNTCTIRTILSCRYKNFTWISKI